MEKIGLVDGDKLMRIVDGSLDLDDFHKGYFESFVKASRVPIQPVAKIEAAIRYMDQYRTRRAKHIADLLRWVLREDQNNWDDADFGLEGGEEE